MSVVVDELIAELGIKVDPSTFAAAQKGLDAVRAGAQAAQRAVARVGGLRALGSEAATHEAASTAATKHATALDAVGASAEHAAQGGVKSFLHGLEGMVAGFLALEGVHIVREFAHEMMELGSNTEHAATRLGITTKRVQELRYAAKQTDVEAGNLDNGLRFLQVSAAAAASGGKAQAAVYRELGVAVKDSSGRIKGTDVLFEEVADGIEKITDPAKRSAAAQKIFGRGAAALIPLLAEGGKGIRAYREEAESLGGGFSEDALKASAELEHQVKRFDFALLSVKGTIATYVLPVLSRLAKGFSAVVRSISSVYRETKFLQVLFAGGFAYAVWTGVRALLAFNAAQWRVIAAKAVMVAEFILAAVAIAAFLIVVEDLYQLFTGGKSQIALWIDQFAGIGTIDDAMRSWAVGVDTLSTALKGLLAVAGGVLEFIGLLSAGGDTSDASKKIGAGNALLDATFSGGDDSSGARAIKVAREIIAAKKRGASKKEIDDIRKGYSAALGPSAQAPIATGRGLGADAIVDQGTPRAVARGMSAALREGSAGFGQVSASAVSGRGSVVDASVHVNVEAKTGADAHEIGRIAAEHVRKGQARQAKHVANALAPRGE